MPIDKNLPAEPPVDQSSPLPGGEPDQHERSSPRSITLGIAFMATVLLIAGLAIIPSPYAVKSPGPTRDTLGQDNSTDLIQISGAPTYDSTGKLLLTTVGVGGGPGYPVNLVQVLQGWVDPTRVVVPVETVFPPEVSQQQLDAEGAAEMTSSQENATYAALTELGYDVPVVVSVVDTDSKTDAAAKLEKGDVIELINGTEVATGAELVEVLRGIDPGTEVSLGLLRDGQPLDLRLTTSEPTAGQPGSRLGVVVRPSFAFPVDVQIQIENIGGPSAGTMFSLGIIDKLTPEDEANGQIIAGTGTMNMAGDVGPIGGIQQKMAGAVRDGAAWFLAPASNCDEVVGHVPAGLSVIKVGTLAEARAALVAIGAGTADTLPTCTAADTPASAH